MADSTLGVRAGIMGRVADREDQRPGGDTPPGGIPAPGEPVSGEPASPAGTEPGATPPMDAEQLRQFQQFQQFQEFLRFNEAQQQGATMVPSQPRQPAQAPHGPPPVPPPGGELVARPPGPKAPKWMRKLGGKALSALIFFLLLGLGLTWAYNHFFGTGDDDATTEEFVEGGGGTYRTNQILSTNPYEAVRTVYDAVAQNLVPQGCGRFAETQQQEFAQNLGFADCKVAVESLHGQVGSVNDYAESVPSYTSKPIEGDTITIDSCQFPIDGGPALGVFTATKVEKGQWLITGHQPGPRDCPAPSSTAPSSSAPGN